MNNNKKNVIGFTIASIIFLAIYVWILWLLKVTFSINNAVSWLELIICFLSICLISTFFNFNILKKITGTLTILSICILILGAFFSSDIFHAKSRYDFVANMVTVIEDSDEISAFPNLLGNNNDTSNLPLIGEPEAIKRAETEMGKIPALGSQFQINSSEITSQNINDSLMYVVPLEPKNMFKWDSETGNYGYFIIDRNNQKTNFVETSLKTVECAPFGDNTERIIYNYLRSIHQNGRITELSPEVDEEGNFHYVATVYTTSGIEGLDKVIGIVDVNAITKECQYYSLKDVPDYVDRVYPEDFFTQYLKYYGSYKKGWWNSIIGQKEVLEQTDDYDIIYIDGVCYYYTGYTSTGKGESSNGIMLMNCRTGEIEYHITYGISEEKAQGVAEGRVQEKGYKASYPLLLNISGEETYFMLMRDENENLCGYAFVNYKDYTKAAVGDTLLATQELYIKSCLDSKSSSTLNNDSLAISKGTISSIASEVKDGNTIYYVRVNGEEQIFSFYSEIAPEIVFAKEGNNIEIEYIPSDTNVISAVTVKLDLTVPIGEYSITETETPEEYTITEETSILDDSE